MSFQHIPLSDALLDYVRQVSGEEPDYLAQLREETAKDPRAVMQITVEQGLFMGLLAKLINARKAIEIGVFTGYSSLSVAKSLPDDGRLIACDVNEAWTSIARKYWKLAGLEKKIDLRLKPAVETLDELLSWEAGTFDFAFIDADKVNYDAYYERCLRLLRSGGLMLIDNVLWHGQVIDPEVNDADTLAIRALNAKLRTDSRVDQCMLPMGDGITMVRKK